VIEDVILLTEAT